MTNILPYLERIRDRFADPTVHESFKDFSKTLQFEFPDTKQAYLMTVVNGQVTLEETSIPNPDMKTIANTDVLAGIMDKKINPMTAFMTRKIKAHGAQEDLLKLQKLML
jgi:putative sterol carrier protein